MLRPSGVQLFSPKTPRGTGPGTQEVTSECLLNVKKQYTLIRNSAAYSNGSSTPKGGMFPSPHMPLPELGLTTFNHTSVP